MQRRSATERGVTEQRSSTCERSGVRSPTHARQATSGQGRRPRALVRQYVQRPRAACRRTGLLLGGAGRRPLAAHCSRGAMIARLWQQKRVPPVGQRKRVAGGPYPTLPPGAPERGAAGAGDVRGVEVQAAEAGERRERSQACVAELARVQVQRRQARQAGQRGQARVAHAAAHACAPQSARLGRWLGGTLPLERHGSSTAPMHDSLERHVGRSCGALRVPAGTLERSAGFARCRAGLTARPARGAAAAARAPTAHLRRTARACAGRACATRRPCRRWSPPCPTGPAHTSASAAPAPPGPCAAATSRNGGDRASKAAHTTGSDTQARKQTGVQARSQTQ